VDPTLDAQDVKFSDFNQLLHLANKPFVVITTIISFLKACTEQCVQLALSVRYHNRPYRAFIQRTNLAVKCDFDPSGLTGKAKLSSVASKAAFSELTL